MDAPAEEQLLVERLPFLRAVAILLRLSTSG